MMIHSHIIDGLYMSGANTLAYPDVLRQHCITHVIKLFQSHELSHRSDPMPISTDLRAHLADLPQGKNKEHNKENKS